MSDKRLLSVAEFCRAYGISRAKFYALMGEGLGPAIIRVGARVFVHVQDAEEWAFANRIAR